MTHTLRRAGLVGMIAALFAITGAVLMLTAAIAAFRGDAVGAERISGIASAACGFVGALMARGPNQTTEAK